MGLVNRHDGKFSLNVKVGTTAKSSIWWIPTAKDERISMKVVLKEDNELLDEVVVVGYGTQKKANLTGAVSTVDVSKTLEARPQSDVSKALQGVVPGLTITNTSGKLNSKPTMTIRGTGTLSNSATSNPLIVVDGVPMDDISYLNTQDIDNISVLKDAASTYLWYKTAFGVILVNNKICKENR